LEKNLGISKQSFENNFALNHQFKKNLILNIFLALNALEC